MSPNPGTAEIKQKRRSKRHFLWSSSGGWIRSNDLRIMSANSESNTFVRQATDFRMTRTPSVHKNLAKVDPLIRSKTTARIKRQKCRVSPLGVIPFTRFDAKLLSATPNLRVPSSCPLRLTAQLDLEKRPQPGMLLPAWGTPTRARPPIYDKAPPNWPAAVEASRARGESRVT